MAMTFSTSLFGDRPWVPVMESVLPTLAALGVKQLDPDTETLASLAPTDTLVALLNVGALRRLEYLASVTSCTIFPFAWDVWPTSIDHFSAVFKRCRTDTVFVTSAWAQRELQQRLPHSVVHIPEAINVAAYNCARPLSERPIRVLEFGRKHQLWHESIKNGLRMADITHIYSSSVPGRRQTSRLFPDYSSFISGLQASAVSACFPASVTHPDGRAQGIETLTARYLESMAAGCLVMGKCPSELVTLMGYDPIIQVDMEAPSEQLLAVLEDISSFQPLVDRNRLAVSRIGDWSSRRDTLAGYLANRE